MFYEIVRQFRKQLGLMDKWLDATVEYAKTKSFDPNVLVSFRLAPDQLPLAAQVGIACDTAKLSAARLAGKEAPKHSDDQKTIEELKARIASVVDYLDGFTAKDFEGAETRTITQPRWEGKVMIGKEYFLEHSVPNFYFHLAHTYAILRHNGVPLGKRDYLGELSLRDAVKA